MSLLRKLTEEADPSNHIDPVEAEVKGEIPTWLSGSLIRNGPGLIRIGEGDKGVFSHVFDAIAMLHKFSFNNGVVKYQNRVLDCEAYKANKKAGCVVVAVASVKYPDPCKSIFERFFSHFKSDQNVFDNCNVNVFPLKDAVCACTEGQFWWKINYDDLSSEKRIDLQSTAGIQLAPAHPHYEKDGTVHSLGYSFRNGYYCVFKLDKRETDDTNKTPSQDELASSIIAKVPFRYRFYPGYMHSFGITDKHYVLLEQPYYIDTLSLLVSRFRGSNVFDCFKYYPNYQAEFHVIDRSTGERISSHFVADAFVCFHFINTFESNGCLVVDLVCYESDIVFKVFDANKNFELPPRSQTIRRFVLPLTADAKPASISPDAKAVLTNKAYLCTPEFICSELGGPEMPQISYRNFNGLPYKHVYTILASSTEVKLCKVTMNAEKKSYLVWEEQGSYVSEPVFVPRPDATGEDDGVILSSVTRLSDHSMFLLVLDATTFKEIGRATLPFCTPRDLHGAFFPAQR